MNALRNLKELINIGDITAITTSTSSISIPETLELMKEVNVDTLNGDLVFWTNDVKVIIEEENDDWGTEVTLSTINLKPDKSLVEGIPESVTKVWKDPETGKHLPFKTEAYHAKQRELESVKNKQAKEAEKKHVQYIIDKTEENKGYFESLPAID